MNKKTIGALDFFGKDEQNSVDQDSKQNFDQRQGVKRKITNGMCHLPYTVHAQNTLMHKHQFTYSPL